MFGDPNTLKRNQKSTCLTQSTFGPCLVQIWSRARWPTLAHARAPVLGPWSTKDLVEEKEGPRIAILEEILVSLSLFLSLYVSLTRLAQVMTHFESYPHSEVLTPYTGNLLIRNSAPLGPYGRILPRALW